MEKKLYVEGMMCMHCKAKVEKALCAVPGVHTAIVDLEGKSAMVSCDASVTDDALLSAVTAKGFDARMA